MHSFGFERNVIAKQKIPPTLYIRGRFLPLHFQNFSNSSIRWACSLSFAACVLSLSSSARLASSSLICCVRRAFHAFVRSVDTLGLLLTVAPLNERRGISRSLIPVLIKGLHSYRFKRDVLMK